MKAGEVKACWVICSNPVASVANRQQVIDGLRQAELVIAQDAFLDTETNRYADILLPAALWAEGEGVMINSERNLTLMPQAVPAPGQSLADWQIIARVACAMGYAEAFDYPDGEAVFDELRRFWNPATGYDLRGIGYQQLRHSPGNGPARRVAKMTAARCVTSTTAPASSCCAMPRARRLPWRSPLPVARRASSPGLAAGARAARRRLPAGAQHRPRAAPVAHPDQDRQGAGAEQAGAWAIR